MARKVGQIIARGDRRWIIRVYLGRDQETHKRKYHNRTIHGPMREAQAYLTRKLRERDLGRDLEGAKIRLNEYLDRWLFAQPYILLSADVGDDEGYFREKLVSARRQLMRGWQKRITNLQTGFSHTDILGALLLADQLVHERPTRCRNMLAIFSDMRQDTVDLNLETPKKLDARAALVKTETKGLISRLDSVEVYVLGADNAGKPIIYWGLLRGYWLEYFRKTGAHVQTYSALRELPEIAP